MKQLEKGLKCMKKKLELAWVENNLSNEMNAYEQIAV
jgi:hypothetical protein